MVEAGANGCPRILTPQMFLLTADGCIRSVLEHRTALVGDIADGVVPVPATGLALVGAEGPRNVGKPVYFVVGEDARSSEESDKKERLGLNGSLRSARGAIIKLSKPGTAPDASADNKPTGSKA